MGLFDAFQFSPSSFNGSGGLLANLPSWLYQNQQGQGFGTPDSPLQYGQNSNVAVGGYQMPVFGQGDPATLPNSAQPVSGQQAAPATESSLGIGDRLLSGLSGFAAGGRTGGLIGALTGGVNGAITGQTPENQTMKVLVANGFDPATAQAITKDPALLRSVFSERLKRQFLADDPMRKLQMEKLRVDIDKAREGGTEYSLTPTYGIDENGNTVLGTVGKNGTFKKIDTGGVKIQSGVEKVDLGSHYQLRDKRTGQVVGVEPKDLRGAEREKGIGESQGKAVASAPADIQAGQNALDILDKVEKHPYLERGTGFSSLLNSVPGTGGHDFANLVEQAKSGAFLQAIQQMRGLGSLSNAEGGAATAAITRMNTSTSQEAFLEALSDYRRIVKQGIARAQSRLADPSATNPQSGQPAAAAPASGAVRKFNPATGKIE